MSTLNKGFSLGIRGRLLIGFITIASILVIAGVPAPAKFLKGIEGGSQ